MYQRGKKGIYWTNFTIDGKTIRQSTGTTDPGLAAEKENQIKTDHFRGKQLGHVTETWEQAVIAWTNRHAKDKSLSTTQVHLRWLDTLPQLKGRVLDKVNADAIGEITDRSLATKVIKNGTPTDDCRSPSTTNRYLETVRKILICANERGKLHTLPKFVMLGEPPQKDEFISAEEAGILLAELAKSNRLAETHDAVKIALATGLRHANVVGLEWRHIDLDKKVAWIKASSSKNARPIRVPLNDDAMEVLHRRHGANTMFVFVSCRGKRLTRANTDSFNAAMERVGLGRFTFHDLRHCWASNHARMGTPLQALQALGGWRTLGMVDRYAHLAPSHLDQFANNSALGTQSVPTPQRWEGKRKLQVVA